MSSTTRWGESTASAFAINSRLIRLRPSRFSSWLSTSVSNQCRREGNAAPRSQIFSEPINRNVGSCDNRSASFTSSYPAKATVDGLSQQIRERQLRVFAAPVVHDILRNERTQSQTFIQLTDQQQTTIGSNAGTLEINFQTRVKRELKRLILFLPHWVEPP